MKKAIKLNTKMFFILVITLGTVAAIPMEYTGLDGRVYIIEPELKVTLLGQGKYFYKNKIKLTFICSIIGFKPGMNVRAAMLNW